MSTKPEPSKKLPTPKIKRSSSIKKEPVKSTPTGASKNTPKSTSTSTATKKELASTGSKPTTPAAKKEKTAGSAPAMKSAKELWEAKGPPPERTIIVTDDGQKWEAYDGKFCKVPAYGSLDSIRVDDSLLIIDPIHIIPGEKCKCGRPQTELEKSGIYTYGDYLQKCTIKGSASNPYGKHLKFSNGKEGLGAVIRSYEKPKDLMVPVLFKKRSGNRVGDVIIRF
jgi:hypothetical protein